MKKILIVTLLAFILIACGKENSDNSPISTNKEKVEIDFWTFWGSELRRPIIESIINDFNEENENIDVKHTYNPYGDIWTKELAAIAAGNPPDVVINDINATAIRGQKKRAENLAEYLDDNFSKKFFPYLWDAMIYEDGVYGIPFTTDTRVLFYNKDLFREVGLDPERPPKTWEELIEFGNRLDKKNEKGDYEVMGFYPLYNVGPDVWIINANGKNYLDSDGKADINTQTNEEVLSWLIERRQHYGKDVVDRFQSKVDGEQSHPFLTQELAMMAGTGTFYRQIKDYAQDFELGVAVLPEFKEGSGNTSWGGGFVVEIPYGAKNKDESWKFIEYLTEKHAQTLWGALNFDNVANSEASKAVGDSKELNKKDQEVYKILDENMENTILTPTPIKMPNYFELVNPVLEDIILERIDVQKGLESIQKSLEDLYDENS